MTCPQLSSRILAALAPFMILLSVNQRPSRRRRRPYLPARGLLPYLLTRTEHLIASIALLGRVHHLELLDEASLLC